MIKIENFVLSGVKSAFDKVKDSDDYGVPYDYASIMHYPWHAFTKNGQDTMTPKKTVTKQPYIDLSDGDALQTNRMYQCSGKQNVHVITWGLFYAFPFWC